MKDRIRSMNKYEKAHIVFTLDLGFQKLSDALEGSKNKIETKLPVGSCIVANNYFWLHGRKPFKENKNLSRELLRIRGAFFN